MVGRTGAAVEGAVIVSKARSVAGAVQSHDARSRGISVLDGLKTAPPAIAGGRLQGFDLSAVESDADHVRSVEPFLAGADLELHFLSFGERLEPFHTDGGEVDEDVLTAVLFNEAVPLGVIEPLHLTSGHSRCLRQDESLLHGRCASR